MLTLPELQAMTIDPVIAREAHTQVERHLLDILEVRKTFEQKASTLMGAYITLSVALFGIGGAIFKDAEMIAKAWPFFGAGLVFVVGAGCFIAALKSGQYAAIGSTPEMWLNAGTIDGGDHVVAAMLAYIVFHHRDRISISERGNRRKASWIDAGIFLGPVAPIVSLVLFLVL